MTDRDKLIELIHDGVGCPDGRHPFGDVCDGCKYFPSLDCNTERLADSLIANGVVISNSETTTQRWIPVTERLPEEGGRYLCYVKSFAFKGAFYTTILHYDKYGFAEGNIYTDDVTHWMLMPEPPEEV